MGWPGSGTDLTACLDGFLAAAIDQDTVAVLSRCRVLTGVRFAPKLVGLSFSLPDAMC